MYVWLKRFSSILLSLLLLFVAVGGIFAQIKTSPSPAAVAEVNSFELFWPLVAGKVPGDSLYSLKRLKENARGSLIFSPIKKAEYLAFLATKRVLEAEKLANDGRSDLAKKALNQALSDIKKSDNNLKKSISRGEQAGPVKSSVAEKLNKLETFLKSFLEKKPDLKNETQILLDKVMAEAGQL